MADKRQPGSRESTLEELAANLTTGELRAFSTAIQEVIGRSGYGEIQLEIRKGRVYLIAVKRSMRPAIAAYGIG